MHLVKLDAHLGTLRLGQRNHVGGYLAEMNPDTCQILCRPGFLGGCPKRTGHFLPLLLTGRIQLGDINLPNGTLQLL